MPQSRGVDTAYVEEQHDKLNLRFYFSRKYTDFLVGKSEQTPSLRYLPNSGLNMGLGVTHQNFTLNIAVPFGFLNPERKTDWPPYLDLQVHVYPTYWIIDLFGQFYNGFTVSDYPDGGESYLREDMKLRKVGFNANYLFSGDKISFAAAMLQSAIQKRSAWSPMVGFEAYRVMVKGDSLLLPSNEFVTGNFERADYIQFGPNAGLVGTLVFGKGFFLTGAASTNLGIGYSRFDRDSETKLWKVLPTYTLRGFAGYNAEKFSVNFNYVYKQLNLGNQFDFNQSANTGNYRINVIYKLNVSPKFQRTYAKFNPLRILSKK